MKKKCAIKDTRGQCVLIETIAAYKKMGSNIKLNLRNGSEVTLNWNDYDKCMSMLDVIDSHFDIVK